MNLLLALVTMACVATAGSPENRHPSHPDPRVPFRIETPAPMQLGKLWMDVGLFFPWTSGVARVDWERDYFQLLNEASKNPTATQPLMARAIGLLNDPASLVLPTGCGKGAFFMPVLWEVKPDGLWLVGGDTSQVSEPFGPIKTINNQSLEAFLDLRVGTPHKPAQAIAALNFSGISEKEVSWEVTSQGGKSLTLKSVNTLPASAWIEGGWQGTPVHALPKDLVLPKNTLDLRTAPWFEATFTGRAAVLNLLETLSAKATPTPIAVIRWQRYGFSEQAENLTPYPYFGVVGATEYLRSGSSTASENFNLIFPSTPIGNQLALKMAGYILPHGTHAVADWSMYSINPFWSVRLRTATWSASGSTPGRNALGSIVDSQTINGPKLTRTAATYLAAASLANFDHLFAFTPANRQANHFQTLVNLASTASSATDLYIKAGRTSGDAHWSLSTLFYSSFAKERLGPNATNPLSFYQVLPSHDQTQLLITSRAFSTEYSNTLKPGDIISSIDGVLVKDWLLQQQAIFEVRPGDWARIAFSGLDFDTVTHQDKPARLQVRSPQGDTRQIETLLGANRKSLSDAAPKTPLPAGWSYVGPGGVKMEIADIVKECHAGKSFVLDCRVGNNFALTGTLNNWGLKESIATPKEPVEWGSVTPRNTASFTEFIPSDQILKVAPGIIVFLVSSWTQSSLETSVEGGRLYGTAHGVRTYLVGLGTAGVTGATTQFRLPVGESDKTIAATMTAAFPVFNYGTFNYVGLPLDHEFQFDELKNAFAPGVDDLFLAALAKLAPTLGSQRPIALDHYPNFKWKQEPVWGRCPQKSGRKAASPGTPQNPGSRPAP